MNHLLVSKPEQITAHRRRKSSTSWTTLDLVSSKAAGGGGDAGVEVRREELEKRRTESAPLPKSVNYSVFESSFNNTENLLQGFHPPSAAPGGALRPCTLQEVQVAGAPSDPVKPPVPLCCCPEVIDARPLCSFARIFESALTSCQIRRIRRAQLSNLNQTRERTHP